MSITQDITTTIPLLVDRSPELLRNAIPNWTIGFGRYTHTELYYINEDVIAHARRGDGAACAIAVVIKRRHPDWDVSISGEMPVIGGQKMAMAESIVEWVGKFDRNEPVEPIEFQLYFS